MFRFLICVWFYLFNMALAINLEAYNIDPNSISVSGLSSGAAMATQFHVAFSRTIQGAGVFAGVPYYCALGTLGEATTCMLYPSLINVPLLVTDTKTYASLGSIDPTSELSGDKVFIFHGIDDSVVHQGAGEKVEAYYGHFMDTSDIKTVFTYHADHGYPTETYGGPCGSVNKNDAYMNKCGYNGAYDALNYLFGGNLVRPSDGTAVNGLFDNFEQAEFFSGNPSSDSMDGTGFIYVPSGCLDKTTTCQLHVVFHGCEQGQTFVGDIFVKNAGYLEVAELNNIIVLFPQAIKETLMNPNGCWDWWGYTGTSYATKNGKQMRGVQSMIDRLLGN